MASIKNQFADLSGVVDRVSRASESLEQIGLPKEILSSINISVLSTTFSNIECLLNIAALAADITLERPPTVPYASSNIKDVLIQKDWVECQLPIVDNALDRKLQETASAESGVTQTFFARVNSIPPQGTGSIEQNKDPDAEGRRWPTAP